MTFVYDEPGNFRSGVLDGFAKAYARYVHRVPAASGFVRAEAARAGKVGVVVGGGSGHYPSYAGIVGPGLADGCVLGEVFTSPSAEQVYRVARQVDAGAGVILAFGNYAGDRLNFAAAAQRLADQGIDTRVVYVTDDIASAPSDSRHLRRGIAGTVFVYKAGGAAADAGYAMDDVERVMRKANDRTVSFGVAFAGCTLPGASEPLFTVMPGSMEFGLGIHGEQGVRSADWMPAKELAASLVDALLHERPADCTGRVAVILNGLGATKYEELFVLYSHVGERLAAAGLTAVEPEVGEMVTSLDMAGCSLSLMWLDEELERMWLAPCQSAAFRRSEVNASPDEREWVDMPAGATRGPTASPASRAAARVAVDCLVVAVTTAQSQAEAWGHLDAAAGDGDHGTGMLRGLTAASEAAATASLAGAGVGSTLGEAAIAFSDEAGGTSGILWGILLSTMGARLGDINAVSAEDLSGAVAAAAAAVSAAGGAALGDKTMVDALEPFARTLAADSAADFAYRWEESAREATRSAEATAALVAQVGRARPLGERSRGIPDPGATSFAAIVTSLGPVFAQTCINDQGDTP